MRRPRLPLASLAASLLLAALPLAGAHAEAPSPQHQDAAANYRIGPGDMLQIEVFQLADLGETVQVDMDGRISVPLLGKVPAGGSTAGELSAVLAGRLQDRYVNDPIVTVSIKDAQGQRITVDGAVAQPGVYRLTGPTTLIQAVAMANGVDSTTANAHRVLVFRVSPSGRVAETYDLVRIRKGDAPDPVILGQDEIVVASSHGRAALRVMGQILPVLALVGGL